MVNLSILSFAFFLVIFIEYKKRKKQQLKINEIINIWKKDPIFMSLKQDNNIELLMERNDEIINSIKYKSSKLIKENYLISLTKRLNDIADLTKVQRYKNQINLFEYCLTQL